MIEHVALWANDLEALKDFYTCYLPCKAGALYENKANGFSSYFLSFQAGARLELMQMPGIMDNPSVGGNQSKGWVHIAISMGSKDAVDTLYRTLKDAGETLIDSPHLTGDGYYEFTVLDIEHNRIEITL
jgi:lactoylglutathione lyase